jgi:ABC-type transport system involved in cytochrome bd biosynthesis fused ATPase/permease subunit
MSEYKKNTQINLGLTIGILGFIAGIGLLFTDSWFIGIFGLIASASVAYQGYQTTRNSPK